MTRFIKYITVLVAVAALFGLSTPLPVAAAGPGEGVIEGQLINGTGGGSSVASQDVALRVYLNDVELDPAMTVADAEGRFAFNGLSTETGYSYEVKVIYQDAEYYSEIFSFSDNETALTVQMTVYDSTTSDQSISVMTSHTIIYVGQGSLMVKEYYLFVNTADRTYIGPEPAEAGLERQTLRFSLPDGVAGVQVSLGLMDCCIQGSVEGFNDTMSVQPGVREIAYSYNLNYGSGDFELPLKINYPTAQFDLMVQGGEVGITGTGLTEAEPLSIEGTEYSHFTGQELTAGDDWQVQLSGLTGSGDQNFALWVVLTLLVLVGVFGLGYYNRRKRAQPVAAEKSQADIVQGLVGELARLDDDFEGGGIGREDYRRLRAEKKALLMELMRKPPASGG